MYKPICKEEKGRIEYIYIYIYIYLSLKNSITECPVQLY